MINAARLSIRAWIGLIFLLYILCEVNALECGMRLVNGAPTAPVVETGQTIAMIVGSRTGSSTVFITDREQMIYDFWLSCGMAALVLGLTLVFGYGIRLALAERRAKLARAPIPTRRRDGS
jgi:hypothetical protein